MNQYQALVAAFQYANSLDEMALKNVSVMHRFVELSTQMDNSVLSEALVCAGMRYLLSVRRAKMVPSKAFGKFADRFQEASFSGKHEAYGIPLLLELSAMDVMSKEFNTKILLKKLSYVGAA